MFWDEMQGDNLPAKVALAGCAQYASEYARDLLTMEGSKDKPVLAIHIAIPKTSSFSLY